MFIVSRIRRWAGWQRQLWFGNGYVVQRVDNAKHTAWIYKPRDVCAREVAIFDHAFFIRGDRISINVRKPK
jgi:hypothetical protein